MLAVVAEESSVFPLTFAVSVPGIVCQIDPPCRLTEQDSYCGLANLVKISHDVKMPAVAGGALGGSRAIMITSTWHVQADSKPSAMRNLMVFQQQKRGLSETRRTGRLTTKKMEWKVRRPRGDTRVGHRGVTGKNYSTRRMLVWLQESCYPTFEAHYLRRKNEEARYLNEGGRPH